MSSVVISGNTSGSVTLDASAIAGTTVYTLAPVSGTISPLVSGTAVASTSGTSIDFTGIPSWVKRITVMLSGVSLSGTSALRLRIGAGSIETTGYTGMALRSVSSGSVGTATFSLGYDSSGIGVAASSSSGHFILTNLSGNIWVVSANIGMADASTMNTITGTKTTATTLDRLSVTTVNGTDTFDAGSINIMYE